MFINPKIAIEEGWVTGIHDPDLQVQPNAIDFTLDKVFTIDAKPFILDENSKQMRGGSPLEVQRTWNGTEMGRIGTLKSCPYMMECPICSSNFLKVWQQC